MGLRRRQFCLTKVRNCNESVANADPGQTTMNAPSNSASPLPGSSQHSSDDSTSPQVSREILDDVDFEVSDASSDLDPEDLITTYLSAKAQLYEKRPDVVKDDRKKSPKVRRGQKEEIEARSLSSGVVKLQQKLRKIEADILFDQAEADLRWSALRNTVAQVKAQRKRLHLVDRTDISGSNRGPATRSPVVAGGEKQNAQVSDDDIKDDDVHGGGGGETWCPTIHRLYRQIVVSH